MISISGISNWITETIGGYFFPIPEFPNTSPEERTSFQTPEIGSHQVAVLRDTESIPFEIPENNRMEVLDCNPDRGVKRLLDDDDEPWSISRKKPKSPERKRIRLDDSPSPNATTRRFISKWNRSKQQLRKFQPRRCVNISESVPELDPIIARNTIEKMEIDPFVPKNRKKWRKRKS